MAALTIGKVAEQAGVNIETLRYYEREGIIPEPIRNDSNYRIYAPGAVQRVRFVKRAQQLGFSLGEIKGLLALRATRGAHCGDVRDQATAKIEDLDDRIRALQAMRGALSKLVAECSGNGPITECPILELLDSDAEA